jgi:TIR domain
MSSLADRPELVGFFSYSRDDDEGSRGALSALRDAIQNELSAQLGRTRQNFRLWQDHAAIAPGTLWESEIAAAVAQSAFFIPMITPRVILSSHCRLEFESFLAREKALGRADLVFPMLYVSVPALEDEAQWRNDPMLSIIGARQWVDWRKYRHLDVNATAVREAVETFCSQIAKALRTPLPPPVAPAVQIVAADTVEEAAAQRRAEEERIAEQAAQQQAQADARRAREIEEARRKAEAERLAREAETKQRAEAEVRRAREAEEARRKADDERRDGTAVTGPSSAAAPVLFLVWALVAPIALQALRESGVFPTTGGNASYGVVLGILAALIPTIAIGFGGWRFARAGGRRIAVACAVTFVGFLAVPPATVMVAKLVSPDNAIFRSNLYALIVLFANAASGSVMMFAAAGISPFFRNGKIWAMFLLMWVGASELSFMLQKGIGLGSSPSLLLFAATRAVAYAVLGYWLHRAGAERRD